MARPAPLLLLVLMGLPGCTADDTSIDEAPPDGGQSAQVAFLPPAVGPLYLADAPFPSDLFLAEDGTVEIAGVTGANDVVVDMLGPLNERRGFCRSCTITFPIVGRIEPASVPPDASADEASGDAGPTDAVLLVRADGFGGFVPLDLDWSAVDHALIARPAYGNVLAPETVYVAAITNSVLAEDGSPLAPSPSFKTIRDGGEPGDPVTERMRTNVEGALGALEALGVAHERIVAATTFTTDDGAWLLRGLRQVVDDAPAPTLTVTRVLRAADGDLDALLGIPSEDRPGTDIPPEDGVGNASIVHDGMQMVVFGTFDTPRVVQGAGSDIGRLRTDGAGVPAEGPDPEQVPFLLIVPFGDLSSVPVVLAHHGMPATQRFGLQVGNTFARMGMAVLAYDAFSMGARSDSAFDGFNEFRGLAGADGIAEHDDQTVSLRLAGVDADSAELARSLGSGSQHIVDAAMALRLVTESDLGGLRRLDPTLTGLGFDASQLYYVGQSFGALVGMTTLPIVKGVQGAVLSVGPPDSFEHLCTAPKNRMDSGALIMAALGVPGAFDEVGRRLCMHPYMNLARWLLEPVAAINALHYLLEEPLHGGEPPDLLFLYATYDRLIGITGEHVLGAAGITTNGPTSRVALMGFDAPLSANHMTPNGTITAGGWIYDAGHSLLRRRGIAVEWEQPFFPPFVPLDPPQLRDNPIEEAHAQMEAFIRSRMTDGRAVIIDPSVP